MTSIDGDGTCRSLLGDRAVSAPLEVVARDGVVIPAVVVARIDVDRRGAEPGGGVQHRVADTLRDGMAV